MIFFAWFLRGKRRFWGTKSHFHRITFIYKIAFLATSESTHWVITESLGSEPHVYHLFLLYTHYFKLNEFNSYYFKIRNKKNGKNFFVGNKNQQRIFARKNKTDKDKWCRNFDINFVLLRGMPHVCTVQLFLYISVMIVVYLITFKHSNAHWCVVHMWSLSYQSPHTHVVSPFYR